MPVEKRNGSWWWGSKGPFDSEEKAREVEKAAYANGYASDSVLAFDRSSARTYDADGMLHVSSTPISKANICVYYGKEIPNGQQLGLIPEKAYRLYRDPEELKRAARTFNKKPILNTHIGVDVSDPPKEAIIGCTGEAAEFDGTYLKNTMVIWDGSAIAGIETGEQRENSSSYRYRADMTPGEVDGEQYDGVMRDIVGNHVAVVPTGRAGPDVFVYDSKPTGIKPMSNFAKLWATIYPHLANDADPEAVKEELKKVADDEEATRAERDNESEAERLKREEKELKEREDRERRDRDRDRADDDAPRAERDNESEAERLKREERELKDRESRERKDRDRDRADDEDDDDDKVSKKAMDAAIRLAKDSAVRDAVATLRKAQEAQEIVRPIVGDLVAMDSADEVYRTALKAAGVDVKGVHASAYPAMVQMVLNSQKSSRPAMAMDSASLSSFEQAFPTAGKLKRG